MYSDLLYVSCLAAVIYAFLPSAFSEETMKDPEISDKIGEYLTHVFKCKKELDDAGTEVIFPKCIEMYTTKVDETKPEFAPCKCIGACVAKKVGTMKADGSAWDSDKITEFTKILSKSEMFKPFANEIDTVIRPACLKATVGADCELFYNTIRCVFEKSESARNFRDMFIGALKAED